MSRLLWAACLFSFLAGRPLLAADIEDAVVEVFEPLTFQSGDQSIPYRIMKPLGAEPGKRYPLVLLLHGAGERGADNVKPLVHGAAEFAHSKRRRQDPAFVVVPQCPDGKRWVESDWGLPSGRGKFDDRPSDPMRLVLELVDQLAIDLPVDPSRMYVTGLSMGGMGAWYAAQAEPKRFAAMLEICGGGDPEWADRYAGVAISIFHGQDDQAVPIERNREMVAALANVGHHPELHYVEYPGVGHNSWSQTYQRDDVFAWLFAQGK